MTCGSLLLSAVAAAQPTPAFRQALQQLQQNPSDGLLRERVIAAARELRQAPPLPEEAERRMVRGATAFKMAKSTADYQLAAQEFEKATEAAPWYGDAYFNLGVARDKAGDFDAALRALRYAQLSSPGSHEIRALIYEVEFRAERARTAAAPPPAREKGPLEGADFYCPPYRYEFGGHPTIQEVFRVKDGQISWWRKVVSGTMTDGDGSNPRNAPAMFAASKPVPLKLSGSRISYNDAFEVTGFDVAPDGQSITARTNGWVCRRQ